MYSFLMENTFTLTDRVSSPVVELCPQVGNQQRHEGLFIILEIHFLNTSSQKQSIVWLPVCVGKGRSIPFYQFSCIF